MKKISSFSKTDLQQIKGLGLSPQVVEKQLATYRCGTIFFKLNRPCTLKDGIISISPVQREKLIDLYENETGKYKLIKFIPASGAASRMFAEWFSASEKGSFGSPELDRLFLRNLKKLPFFNLIEKDKRGQKLVELENIKSLLEFILLSDGLDFGRLPKALIPFHRYSIREVRTALEEHLCEAAQYICGAGDFCSVHFTSTAEHKKDLAKILRAVTKKYKNICQVKYKVTLSIQSLDTNTLAINENNLPLRDDNGKLFFRPGGHGALLKNLNNLNADLIFIKNIDNIAPEVLFKKIIPYEKMLGGLALKIQKEIFTILKKLEKSEISIAQLEEIVKYCYRTLNIVFPPGFAQLSSKEKNQIIFSLLNRPLRICGMVKNEGEPGGSPFWVDENAGTQTLQIVEIGHVDKGNPEQLAIWLRAKYFNPVDMICCIKNYHGDKFNLDNYVNRDAYLITKKNEKGQNLKALEAPGLWNGGMAYWNTIFVELPLRVFNPVKNVWDLLRPEHLTYKKHPKTK